MTTKRRPLRRKKGKLQIKIKSWEFPAPAKKLNLFAIVTPSGHFFFIFQCFSVLVLKIYCVGETLNKILSVAKRNLLRARRRPRRRRTKWAWRTARWGTTTPRSPSVRGKTSGGLAGVAGDICCCQDDQDLQRRQESRGREEREVQRGRGERGKTACEYRLGLD